MPTEIKLESAGRAELSGIVAERMTFMLALKLTAQKAQEGHIKSSSQDTTNRKHHSPRYIL
jgi:hypothetical protein